MVRGFREAIDALAMLTTVQANHHVHVPATDSFEESDLRSAVPSISRLRREVTNEAGPSGSRRGPNTSGTSGHANATTAVGTSRNRETSGARRSRAAKVS